MSRSHPNPLQDLWNAHKSLLNDAPGIAWLIFALSWLTLALILCAVLLQVLVQRQDEHLQHASRRLAETVESRLKSAELLLYGMDDMIGANPSVTETQLRNYARESVRRNHFILSMGYQTRVPQSQRSPFEAHQSALNGTPYQIRDYPHVAANDWQTPGAWRRAAERDSYIPLSMAIPALPAQARGILGLDLFHDSVLGPSVQRALQSGDIEISPPFNPGQGAILAFVQAIYRAPPSPSPLMRPEEATGVVLILLRVDPLIAPNDTQSPLLDITLARQTGASPRYDDTFYQHKANAAPGWLDALLPRFSQSILIETAHTSYELTVSSQQRMDMLTRRGMLAAVLLAILPSYLILLIVAIRHTAQKNQDSADDSLFRTREHATVTLQAISDAVITIDNAQTVQYLNAAASLLLGVPEKRAIGRVLTDIFKLRYEFARQAVPDPVEACLTQRKALILEENSFLLDPYGQKLLVEGTVSPLFDRTGGMIGAVLTFRDTAPLRRRILEALEKSEARLRQHESELAHVSRITSMGEMASGIAHEINQPLAAIMNYCQASLSLLEEEEPDLTLIARALQSAVNQADRAGTIVRRLREFVSNKTRHHTPVDVNLAVANALTLAEHDLRSQQISIEYRQGSHLPLVFVDTIQLEQVVLNLVRNAIDAMQEQDWPGAILVETCYSCQRVCIKVGDNGSGISSDKLDNIFAPFFSTKANGMGLGLTICQTIIESFGGRISAHNRAAGGAEFVVELLPMDGDTQPHTQEAENQQ